MYSQAWAGGATNYAGGPYTMVVAYVQATDYSTGTSYSYGDNSGTWQSIRSSGGNINGGSGKSGAVAGSPPPSAPSITEVSTGDPTPFGGTHRDPSSTFVTPSVWPWVASATAGGGNPAEPTPQYPGLPSGWVVSTSGKIVPMSSGSCASEFPSNSENSPIAASTFHFCHHHAISIKL